MHGSPYGGGPWQQQPYAQGRYASYGSYPPVVGPPGWAPPPPPPRKSKLKGVLVGIGLATLCIGLSVTNALLDKNAKKSKIDRTAIATVSQELGAVHDALSDTDDLVERACPTDMPPNDPMYGVHVAEWDGLARFATPKPPRRGFRLRSEEPWNFSDDTIFGFHRPEEGVSDQDLEFSTNDAEILKKGRYVLVVRATEKTPPTFPAPGEFVSGSFDGWAVLFDLASGKRLCQARVEAENSPNITHRKKGIITGSTAEEAVMEDLRKNIRSAANDALRRIAPNVSTFGL